MTERKQIRTKTALEAEAENKPRCLHDPLKLATCNHYEYPPKERTCRYCLLRSITDSLEDRIESEAMRWFIAYKNFEKTEVQK